MTDQDDFDAIRLAALQAIREVATAPDQLLRLIWEDVKELRKMKEPEALVRLISNLDALDEWLVQGRGLPSDWRDDTY